MPPRWPAITMDAVPLRVMAEAICKEVVEQSRRKGGKRDERSTLDITEREELSEHRCSNQSQQRFDTDLVGTREVRRHGAAIQKPNQRNGKDG